MDQRKDGGREAGVDCILESACDILSKEEIERAVHTDWAGTDVAFFERTDSTNTRIKALAEAGAPHGTLAVAEIQEGGKGRRGRSWVSPPGVGIWMSLLLRPQIDSVSASMLTLVMALSVSRGIRETTGIDTQIKWPNDLVLNKKKICGILTEMSTELMEIQYIVIGCGINVSQTEFPEEIRETATSLWMETGKRYRRSTVIAGVMEAFEEYYQRFCMTEDMSGLKEEYNKRLVNLGRDVLVLTPSGEYSGISEGINDKGGLIVRLADGTKTEVISGEVSVRGIYGYV